MGEVYQVSRQEIKKFKDKLPPNLLVEFNAVLSALTEEDIKINHTFYSVGFWDAQNLCCMSRNWRNGG